MSTSYFNLTSRYHPPLKQQTTDALTALDGIRDAKPGDIVAVSSSFCLLDPTSAKHTGETNAWIVTEDGIYPVSIFGVPARRIPLASNAMIHVNQDAVLQEIGLSLGHVLEPFPEGACSSVVDLICLNSGLLALRRMTDMARNQGSAYFEKALPFIAAPYVMQGLPKSAIHSITLDLSVFLSQICSRRPKDHILENSSGPVSQATITIQPPGED